MAWPLRGGGGGVRALPLRKKTVFEALKNSGIFFVATENNLDPNKKKHNEDKSFPLKKIFNPKMFTFTVYLDYHKIKMVPD